MLAHKTSQNSQSVTKDRQNFEKLREEDRLEKLKKHKKKTAKAKALFKERASAIMISLCVFAMALIFCILEAKIGICGYTIIETKSEIEAVQNRTKRLELEIADLASLSRVEEYARVKLGMVYPDTTKIAYIDYKPLEVATSLDRAEEEEGPVTIIFHDTNTSVNKVLQGLYDLVGGHFSQGSATSPDEV